MTRNWILLNAGTLVLRTESNIATAHLVGRCLVLLPSLVDVGAASDAKCHANDFDPLEPSQANSKNVSLCLRLTPEHHMSAFTSFSSVKRRDILHTSKERAM